MFQETAPIRRATRRLVRAWGLLNQATAMPLSHCHAMIEMAEAGSLSSRALAQILHLDKSSISRMTAKLAQRGWIAVQPDADRRKKLWALTPKGRKVVQRFHQAADTQVEGALALLTEDGRGALLAGMNNYAAAMDRARSLGDIEIREIQAEDQAAMAAIILAGYAEMGIDPALEAGLDDLVAAYSGPGRTFLVAVRGEQVLGGGGILPLRGEEGRICELQRLYLDPAARGLGLGKVLMNHLLCFARDAGYSACYLETMTKMAAARALYLKLGFVEQEQRLSPSCQSACHRFFLKALR